MDAYFQKKLVIVTGGSEGIGLSTAVQLVSRGADVVIGSRDPLKREKAQVALEARRLHASQILETVALDVLDAQAVQTQFESIARRHRVPDILINSAGFAHPGYFETIDLDTFHHMMNVNYFGVLHAVKAVVPPMRQRGRGQIVTISSMAGYLGLFGYTGYCASKYAVLGFSEALHHELKPYGIDVSVVCPPNTRTPGLLKENQLKPSAVLQLEEKIKTADPDDIAWAMLDALPRRRFMINPTFESKLAYFASRVAPAAVLEHFLRRPEAE